jgi:branched-chain amino acid transport system substrate-binding protein
MGFTHVGRLGAVIAVIAATLGCERRQPAVIGFTFDARGAYAGVVSAARKIWRDSTRTDAPVIVDVGGVPAESGAAGQVILASHLAAYPGILGVVGPSDSRSTLAAAPVYDEAHVPLLVPTATSRRLKTVSPWVFMLAPDDSAEAEFIATFVAQTLHARTAAVFYDNDEYGIGLRDGLRRALPARQARIAAEEPIGSFCAAGQERAEASLVRAMPRANAPGVVIVAGRTQQAACIARRVHERLASTPIIGTDAVEPDSLFFTTAGPAASHFFVVAFWYPGAPGAASAEFARTYEAVTGHPAAASQAMLFDAVSLVRAAAREVGPDREAIRRYLTALGRSRPAYPGVTGAVAFGDVVRPLYMLRALPGAAPEPVP